MRSRTLYDVAALLARIGVGIVFIAHGWQKVEVGITSTAQEFETWGVPAPTGAAVYSTFVELIGGTLLIIGLWLPAIGALLFIDMLGAFVFVHAGEGLFLVDENGVARNGYELVVVLGVASLLLAFADAGRLSLDHALAEGNLGRSRGLRRLRARARDDEDEEDVQSFVDALREAERAPAPAVEKGKKSTRRTKSGSKPSTGETTTRSETTPTLPEAAARPASQPSPSPSSSPTPTGRQARLASDIVSGTGTGLTGTEDDTLVAGRRKSTSRRRRSDTQPMKPRNTGGEGD
jgi:putative oxidoreductase